jgi:hypothetical protein
MVGLLRQSVFSRLAGYEDTNDAERLAVDPAMRHVVGGRAIAKQAASTSQMGRFETEVLHREIDPLLTRPVGRPFNKPVVGHPDFLYQAGSWHRPRRVVAKIEHHKGELLPRVGSIVTNLRRKPWQVAKFYNGRGTAEQWIKEGENAVKWTRLSCHDFVDNQVRLQLFALAYKLGNFLRRLALPQSVKHWSLIPTYVGTAGEADQDRGEGRGALPVRLLPDGGSGRAEAAVPGDPGADTTVAAARDGAGMTARTVERAGEGGGDGHGLLGSTASRYLQPGSVRAIARESPDAGFSEPERRLLDPEIVVASSERPTAVVGMTPSGKSRVRETYHRALPGSGFPLQAAI